MLTRLRWNLSICFKASSSKAIPSQLEDVIVVQPSLWRCLIYLHEHFYQAENVENVKWHEIFGPTNSTA